MLRGMNSFLKGKDDGGDQTKSYRPWQQVTDQTLLERRSPRRLYCRQLRGWLGIFPCHWRRLLGHYIRLGRPCVVAGNPPNLAWESLAEYGARVDVWWVLDVLRSPKGFDLTMC